MVQDKLTEKTDMNQEINKIIVLKSHNIIHWNFLQSINSAIPSNINKALNSPLMNYVKLMKICKCYSDFDRRITAINWHPIISDIVAIASKGGDIILWNFKQDGQTPRVFIKGGGPGFAIQNIIFDERNNGGSVFCTSVDGTVTLKSLVNQNFSDTVFLSDRGCNYNHWYTSLDVNFPTKVLICGDNKGYVNFLTLEGEKQWKMKLHKNKVTHVEFSPREPGCFVTTSIDKTLKVWDIRSLKNSESFLYSLPHEKPVNSARFSRTDGGSVLTTDQLNELRVYKCPTFRLAKKIHHEHRHFQHLTQIKASWHPLRDIAVIGRYPREYVIPEDRCVDFFDCETGEHLLQLFDSEAGNKIHSLNEFNSQGDKLLSAVGSTAFVWKANFDHLEAKEKLKRTLDKDEINSFKFEKSSRKKLKINKL